MEYTIKELEEWNKKIEKIANDEGLNYYPQEFEIISYDDMIAYEAYVGMPSRYPHWSFGKSYERIKSLYRYNLTGLPYEMVINSDPCIAYLVKDNTLLLQILTMAHVYGHNDFFKNNRLFRIGTNASYTVEMFKNHGSRIRSYINDPSIGYENVEKILNAAHALRYQISRAIGEKRISDEELKKRLIEDYKEKTSKHSLIEPKIQLEPPDLSKIPLQPEDDLLYFIIKYSDLSEWEKDILETVREETEYFIPQIETKIMNEGWASFWHYRILNRLELPTNLHLEFIKRHNDVVAPVSGSINPYYLGFEIYKDLEKKHGVKKLFEVRLLDRDQTFIRRYLTEELCNKLNLFEYGKFGNDYIITEVPDKEGFEKIRNTLSDSAGMGMIPYIRVIDMSKKDKTLTLEHVFDGRELNVKYAEETLKYAVELWGHRVILKTNINGKSSDIICDEEKNISYA
ncbi:SpoVR family protein [Thermoanaerobacterium sp. RBIITD]|uniref:SpoVR family protein n=1 Tax=Thermoanaerobacterium sp. RBIITD TaxID=1550240 RepID=UPI000BB84887|nr:SpoVR family protein [Thermoanaerobacterium sp. RBIITD]SNX52696.1 stage V sporulation protein R [Thermoanaerobacterium sp. RBIITD]